MPGDISIPIALRRTRRASSGPVNNVESSPYAGAAQPSDTPLQGEAPCTSTPRKRGRPRKKVRFSDPGPSMGSRLPDNLSSSTGLTPMIRRTSVSVSSSSKTPSRRRHSTPARSSSSKSGLDLSINPDSPGASSPFGVDVLLFPLRQVLDGRVKRRIRRNGLSEEMNAIQSEKKRRAAETRAEIQSLKDQLAAKDAEIAQLQEVQQQQQQVQQQQQQQRQQEQQQPMEGDEFDPDDTMIGDTERIFELQQEITELRRQLANRSGVEADPTSSPVVNWTMAARDPFASDYTMLDTLDFEDDDDDGEHFGEATMADLQCSTPSRRSRRRSANVDEASGSGAGSFLTPPATSPVAGPGLSGTGLMAPMTPSSLRFSTTPRSAGRHAGVQADIPDASKQQLEDELASLQLEICKLTTTLQSYQALTDRISAQVAPFEPSSLFSPTSLSASAPDQTIEPRLTTILTSLSDRTAALLSLSTSLSSLGFPGSDASEIVTSLSTSFRAARLELEYLTPGEVTLPLTSAGAATLDLLLQRLRDLSRRAKEDEASIDEYHAQELSLRQQLSARVDLADQLGAEAAKLRKEADEKDARIVELQVGLERLKGAAASYARDVKELEKLVEKVEGQRVEALAECEKTMQQKSWEEQEKQDAAAKAAQDTAAAALADLEDKLAAALKEAGELRVNLAHAEAARAEDAAGHSAATKKLNGAHGRALALRDARVTELRGEVERVNEALRAAHETARGLRVEKGALEAKIGRERDAAKTAVDGMKAELERVVRMSQEYLAAAATPRKGQDRGQGEIGATPSKVRRASRGGGGIGGAVATAASDGERKDGMPVTVARPGGMFDPALARKRRSSGGGSKVDDGGDKSVAVADAAVANAASTSSKGKKRRRYDSGLGFLDEEEVDV